MTTRYIGLPDGSILAAAGWDTGAPTGEVVAWEYAPVLASGERWRARGEAAAREAFEQWSSGVYADADTSEGDGETYDPVVGVDKRKVTILYGDWERC